MKKSKPAFTTAILLAAGKSRRMGGNVDKLFLPLNGKPVLYYSLRAFQKSPLIDQVFMTFNNRNLNKLKALIKKYKFSKVKKLIKGGRERSDSVALALENIDGKQGWVVIHDGARPMINERMLREGLTLVRQRGSAVIAAKLFDTIKKVDSNQRVQKTVDRRNLFAVQTPQIFKLSLVRNAYRHVRKKHIAVTDDAAAVEARGGKVFLYEFEGANLKITRKQDLPLAEQLIKNS